MRSTACSPCSVWAWAQRTPPLSTFPTALTTANVNNEADTINLAAGGTYVLTAADNGSDGLPVILNDLASADGADVGAYEYQPPLTVSIDSATATGDYTVKSGTVTFAKGETVKTIVVTVLDDALDEDSETFEVALSNPTNVALDTAIATGTIADNDATPTLTITAANATRNEANSGTTSFSFTASLSAPSGRTVTVHYDAASGAVNPALSGSDFAISSSVLTFLPGGSTTRTIRVAVIGDREVEPDETFVVDLSSPVNATIAVAQATGTILNDDTASVSGG